MKIDLSIFSLQLRDRSREASYATFSLNFHLNIEALNINWKIEIDNLKLFRNSYLNFES